LFMLHVHDKEAREATKWWRLVLILNQS
jgi:hypothetical protein